jgi:hypothetical protein
MTTKACYVLDWFNNAHVTAVLILHPLVTHYRMPEIRLIKIISLDVVIRATRRVEKLTINRAVIDEYKITF